MMSKLLEPEELDALLQQQAFAAPRWRTGIVWLLLLLLPFTATWAAWSWFLPILLHSLPLAVYWTADRQPVSRHDVRCLLQWGEAHNLPSPNHLLLGIRPQGASLVWLTDHDGRTLILSQSPQEMCR